MEEEPRCRACNHIIDYRSAYCTFCGTYLKAPFQIVPKKPEPEESNESKEMKSWIKLLITGIIVFVICIILLNYLGGML